MFQTDGYETRSSVLAPAKFEALAAHFEAKLAALPEGQRPEHMDVPHLTDPALFSGCWTRTCWTWSSR